ncbi:hypothetical protein ACFZAM_32120 [Streptomyces sp. NPDC008079]|uniref:hypothetical protein n=1 Tax=Streptomyces sp. NPDC008079 TaxID=3364806 RepID=UPI0036E87375
MTFTPVRITRTYTSGGRPSTGWVQFRLISPMINNGQIADCQPQRVDLDDTGSVSIGVYATNDPGTLPVDGTAYEITEVINGLQPLVSYIVVPYTADSIDLEITERLTGLPAATTLLQPLNQRGLPGGYASLDPNGAVPPEQLPIGLGNSSLQLDVNGVGIQVLGENLLLAIDGLGVQLLKGGEAVRISGAATDIAPLASIRAAGGVGKAADAGHVHPLPTVTQLQAADGDLDMGAHKILRLKNGTAADDAAAFGQIPIPGNAGDLQPGGATAAGSTGRWADAGHVHPANSWSPSDNNLLTATCDPAIAGGSVSFTSAAHAGRIILTKLTLRRTITWGSIWISTTAVAAAGTVNSSYLGVYDSSGVLRAVSADMSAQWMNTTVGPHRVPLASAFTADPDDYYIAMVANGTWTTFTLRGTGTGSSTNTNLSAPRLRYSNMLTGQSSLPLTLDLTAQAVNLITGGVGSQWYGVT